MERVWCIILIIMASGSTFNDYMPDFLLCRRTWRQATGLERAKETTNHDRLNNSHITAFQMRPEPSASHFNDFLVRMGAVRAAHYPRRSGRPRGAKDSTPRRRKSLRPIIDAPLDFQDRMLFNPDTSTDSEALTPFESAWYAPTPSARAAEVDSAWALAEAAMPLCRSYPFFLDTQCGGYPTDDAAQDGRLGVVCPDAVRRHAPLEDQLWL
jgi:hypothetical protein